MKHIYGYKIVGTTKPRKVGYKYGWDTPVKKILNNFVQ